MAGAILLEDKQLMGYGTAVFQPSDDFCSQSQEMVPETFRTEMDSLSGKKGDDEKNLRQYPVDPIVNEIESLAKIRGLEVDSNDIGELVEEHSQELTTEELMELHCVSQQEVMEKSLSEEEKVTAKQQSSRTKKEMLKAWETVASDIEKHNSNKVVAKHATNLFHDNAVSD
ncbi:hypothetical protein AVEN_143394-1 [Araneus ventricosus]|uniref:Uncharacterized protein n=1 Tax=Araneus ventricosus TaxID=182803 RepID=A0A4Y2AEF6_ARAVE|nr:hypothetical protein AVEN_143394-1 [Araneus ventricosus]